jgi:hypothetical protein
MKETLFSERHEKALRNKLFKISLRMDLRRSLLRLFNRYSVWGGWSNEENLTCEAIASTILDRRGWQTLLWWDGKAMQTVSDFKEFIEKGTPHHVLDAIELFQQELDYKKISSFVSELNTLFEIHHSNLRYFRGEFYLIDSAFLESEVLSQAQKLLASNNFEGALEEFLDARSAFLEKDYKRSVLMANHAFESTLKGILGIQKKTGELIKKICRDGHIPSYYEGFLEHFQDFLNIVPTTRSNEAGHGQGKDVTAVPAPLAELALHLSGSLIVFLIKRHIESIPQEGKDEDDPF